MTTPDVTRLERQLRRRDQRLSIRSDGGSWEQTVRIREVRLTCAPAVKGVLIARNSRGALRFAVDLPVALLVSAGGAVDWIRDRIAGGAPLPVLVDSPEHCTACGAHVSAPFCVECGQQVAAHPPAPCSFSRSEGRYCPHCGVDIEGPAGRLGRV